MSLNDKLLPVGSPYERYAERTFYSNFNISELLENGALAGNQIIGKTLTNAEIRNAYRAYNAVVSTTLGDGDTQDIQTAIDSVYETGEGGIVLVRSGLYKPDSPLELKSGISLVGIDPVNTIIDFTNAGDCEDGCIQVVGTAVTDDGLISGTNDSAIVTGSGTEFSTDGVTAGDIIIIAGASYEVATVTNDTSLTITKAYKGASYTDKTYKIWRGMENVNVKNLSVINGDDATVSGNGIEVQNASNVDIENCILQNNSNGIGISTIAGMGTYNVKVTNNISRHNVDNGILISRTYAGSFKDNVCISNGGSGIRSSHSVTGVNVFLDGNVCNSNDEYGIELAVTKYHVIKGCSANFNAIHGIYLEGSGYNSLIGNTTDGNGTDGIHLTNKISVDSSTNIVLRYTSNKQDIR